MRKKPAMFPVTNDGVEWAVYGAVGGAIFGAVNWAVDLTGAERRTAVESVGWAVEEAVNWAVGLAVKEVLRETIASREEPTHPGLGLYLEAVA